VWSEYAFGRSTRGTRPNEGLIPNTLQADDGVRIDPRCRIPVRVARVRPSASAAPAPPEEPPAIRSGSKGVPVGPTTRLSVVQPSPNSGVFVFPITMAPAASNRSTNTSLASATWSSKSREPNVVRTPSTLLRSLIATGTPCRGPSGSPPRPFGRLHVPPRVPVRR